VYTPCIHGEVILASKARRKMDMATCKGIVCHEGQSETDCSIHPWGGRRMTHLLLCVKCDDTPYAWCDCKKEEEE